MSMQDLANLVGVKSWQTVQQWEKEAGGTAPKRTRLAKVAKALQTTPEELQFGPDQSAEWPFRVIDERKYRTLSESDRDRIETALVSIAHSLRIDILSDRQADVDTGS